MDVKQAKDNNNTREEEVEMLSFNKKHEKPATWAERKRLPPDGSWGWLVVTASFLSAAITVLNRGSFYVMYVQWVECFQSDKGLVGWIGSIFNTSGTLLGVLFGALIDLYGCRVVAIIGALLLVSGTFLSAFVNNVYFLFLTFGLLAGVGLGMTSICNYVIVQQYFDKNRALAAGIAALGLSAGGMVGAPLTQMLMDHYGWRGALVINSGISLQIVILSSFFRPLNTTSHNLEKDSTDSTCTTVMKKMTKNISDFSIFKIIPYTMFLVGTFLVELGGIPFYHHVTSHAVFYGVNKQKAALLNTTASLSNATARLITSFLANLSCSNRVVISGIGALLAGIGVMVYSCAVTYPAMIGLGACIGCMNGVHMTVGSTVLVDLVGKERYTKAQAFWSMAYSAGILIGTPFLGYMFNLSGGYVVPMLVAGGIETLGGIIVILIFILKTRYLPIPS